MCDVGADGRARRRWVVEMASEMKVGIAGGSMDVCLARLHVFFDVNRYAWVGNSKNDNEVPHE